MASKTCPNCGSEVDETDAVCTNCGYYLLDETPSPAELKKKEEKLKELAQRDLNEQALYAKEVRRYNLLRTGGKLPLWQRINKKLLLRISAVFLGILVCAGIFMSLRTPPKKIVKIEATESPIPQTESQNSSTTNENNSRGTLTDEEKEACWTLAKNTIRPLLDDPDNSRFPERFKSDGVKLNFTMYQMTHTVNVTGWVEYPETDGGIVRKYFKVEANHMSDGTFVAGNVVYPMDNGG